MEILGFCCGLLTNEDASRSSVNEAFPPRHVPRGAYLFLFALTVDPVFRRKGIAGALLDAELDLARKLECRSVQLIANAFSQPLFEGRGFLAVSSGVSLFAGCRDLMPEPVLMEKMLARQPAEADRRSV